MPFTGYPIPDDTTNLTPAAGQAALHNTLAAACNDLQVQADAPVTSARIGDGTIVAASIADGAITYGKLEGSAKSPSRVTATGSAFAGLTALTTVCSLVLPGMPVDGEWLINFNLTLGVNTPTDNNFFLLRIQDGTAGDILSGTDFEATTGIREPLSGSVFYPIGAATPKTINMRVQRWFGSTSTVDTYASFPNNHIEAKFWPV